MVIPTFFFPYNKYNAKNMNSTYPAFQRDVLHLIPSTRVFDDPLHCLTYGTDASFYRLIPKLVIKVENEAEVVSILTLAATHKLPVTFRAAGTSLSGQAITDSILVLLSGETWRHYEIRQNGKEISLQPGIIGEQVNHLLAPYSRKIGPDPASIATAKIGGIAANNASGMCCGTAQNSYQTLAGMRIVFADGAILDTRDQMSIQEFLDTHSELVNAISALRQQVRDTPTLADKIRHKFRLKNTTGYSLNALTDFDDPIDIIQHLMIGSEGTLGFISEINYKTVIEHAHKATALVLFADIEVACKAVANLKSCPVTAVELMDRAGLRSVQEKPGMPSVLKNLDNEAAALLIDIRAEEETQLQQQTDEVLAVLEQTPPIHTPQFTSNKDEYARLWNIRKGLFPAVGAVREIGTTVIIEDVAFPVPSLAEGTRELQQLFKKYHYDEALIFGHALEGNLHFVFTQDFSTDSEVKRYESLMHDVAILVTERFGGSLKAEHGTGRNMAPFVEMEWGSDAYQLMQKIKQIFDPDNLLNPGVILNDDADIHLKNLKPMPAADPLIDRCIECGFCEPICPSRNLTLSPRQRIVATREMARLKTTQDHPERLAHFEKAFRYEGIDTCAIDGLCATRCPVGIDTGELTRKLRSQIRGNAAKKTATTIQKIFSPITATTRVGLGTTTLANRILGEKKFDKVAKTLHKISAEHIPYLHPYTPKAASHPVKAVTQGSNGKVVYFPSCASRSMGVANNDDTPQDLHQTINTLLEKSDYQSIVPEKVDQLCCGMPFASKGLLDTANTAIKQLEERLWEASEQGLYPILCDTSPCTLRMIEQFTRPLKIYETAGFIHQFLMPHLTVKQRKKSIALHVTCSSRKMGLDKVLLDISEQLAEVVTVPEDQGCCGFAGDKGFTTPELNASALKRLKEQLPDNCEAGYSNSRTCEIGLSLHSGKHYRSIAYLVNECC
ncbi:MAG: Predicted D-lactate dehydrogenase, Fe-S protein, FAD/FMN-containing [uncultured Thiotrichaceae bacterium]|uniref:D-lactate dehydrogenase (cytochrome) n=1 Tax=uncultured Thiotrichaceae bacterium TaxID=298394 RepID=A0A6S6T725_9GAMM|nr:MAG: Predicted D-lactate dehydrogenase, Fe-S protein, FAD/FMN-containing [uncultured Thiotrichaceae bacterium]